MAAERRNSKWYIHGKVKLEDGGFKDYHRVTRGCKLRKEAMKTEDSFLAKYDENLEQMRASNITFKEFTEMYLRGEQGGIKSGTLTTDEYMFDQVDELYDKRINLVRNRTIKDLIESYNTPEYKLSYVNKMRTYLNKLFSFAVKQNLIEHNPISSILNFKRPDELKEEMQLYIPDEWKRFVQASPKDDIMYYAIYCTLYYVGIRRGEVFALNKKDDVDIVEETVHVNKTVSQYVNDRRYIVTPPKTKNSYKVIRMPEEELQIMREYLGWYDSCSGAPADGFLFGIDQPIIPKLLSKRFRRMADATGLPQIRTHDLKHSHATLSISHGANIRAIADRLGSTVGGALKTYSHLFSETKDTVVQVINNIFKR